MKLFLVRWQHQYFYYNDDDYDPRRQARSRLVAAFASREDAQAFCEAIQDGTVPLPAGLNPFIGFRSLREGRHTIGVLREEDPVDRTFLGLGNVTSLSQEELLAALEQLAIAPPLHRPQPSRAARLDAGSRPPKNPLAYDWDEWWEATVAALPEWQRYSIFKLLDRVQLFEIVETELEI